MNMYDIDYMPYLPKSNNILSARFNFIVAQ